MIRATSVEDAKRGQDTGGSNPPPLGMAGTLARLALIGAALAAIAGAFAYFGGWLTPNDLTPARFTDVFEQVDGVHPGFRRNHAKGLGVHVEQQPEDRRRDDQR